MHWLYLCLAITAEIIGSSAIKHSDGFTKAAPAAVGLVSFGVALYFLALALRVLPLGIAYAIWAGAGIVMITLVGWLVFQEQIDLPAFVGIALIVTGVGVINLLSGSVPH
ncbi:MAG: multidrug efflux SMR transporter [Pseudomonadota bacterium]